MRASLSHRRPSIESSPPVKTARLFTNGRSQAVRLPKEFRFEGGEVEIRRDPETGDVVLSQPQAATRGRWQQWFQIFDSLDRPAAIFARKRTMPRKRDIFS
jgi:antitoxin VapB